MSEDDEKSPSTQLLGQLEECVDRKEVLCLLRSFLKLPTPTFGDFSEHDFGTWRTTCSNTWCGYISSEGPFLECPSCGYVEDVDFPCFSSGEESSDDAMSFSDEEYDKYEVPSDHVPLEHTVSPGAVTFGQLPLQEDPFEGVSVIQMAHALIVYHDVDPEDLGAVLGAFSTQDAECDCTPMDSHSLGVCQGYCDEEHDGDGVECTADTSCRECKGTLVCPECDGWGGPGSWGLCEIEDE